MEWKEAYAWMEFVNKDRSPDGPKWSWDCNFKLDFDGKIVTLNSRFYPPHKTVTGMWEGTVSVYLFDEEIYESPEFSCKTLEELRLAVEEFVRCLYAGLRVALRHAIQAAVAEVDL